MWKLIFNSSTNIQTGFGREPLAGEFVKELHRSLCAFANLNPVGRYRWNGAGINEIPGWVVEQDRTAAFTSLKTRIVDKRNEKNNADFSYQGVQYVSDEPNILGVKSQIETLADDAAIPTFTGTALASTWASAEGTFTPFNCGAFRTFASFYYSHREKNFTNYTLLTIAATQAFLGGATIEELEAFDISQGWD